MNYRQDLAAAHGRIDQLQGELVAKEALLAARARAALEEAKTVESAESAVSSATETAAKPAPENKSATEWWHAWPAFLLIALASTYLIRFGTTLPSGSVFDELVPFGRGFLLSGIACSALMFFAYLLRARAEGRSTIGQRLLTALALLVGAPFVIVAGLVALEVASGILTVVMLVALPIGAAIGLVRWIASGKDA
jgi:hypothetical protein